MIVFDALTVTAKKVSTCVQVYRLSHSQFRSKRGLCTLVWRRMVKLSCGGCDDCNGFTPDVDARDVGAENVDIRCEMLEHGALYRVEFHVDGRDPETGYAETWHWGMVPYMATK